MIRIAIVDDEYDQIQKINQVVSSFFTEKKITISQGNRMKKSKKFVKNDGTEKIIIKRTTKTFCLHAYLNRSKSLI